MFRFVHLSTNNNATLLLSKDEKFIGVKWDKKAIVIMRRKESIWRENLISWIDVFRVQCTNRRFPLIFFFFEWWLEDVIFQKLRAHDEESENKNFVSYS